MSGSSTGRYTEVDEFRSSFAATFAEFIVTGRGFFNARTNRADLHHLHLLQVQELLARVAYAEMPSDQFVISFPADAKTSLIWRGVALGPGEIMLHARGEHLHQRIVAPACWGLIMLSPQSFAAFCRAETGRDVSPPTAAQVIRPQPSELKMLLRVHRKAARLAETRPDIVSHPEVVRAMEQELAGVLVRCLTEGDIRAVSEVALRATEVVERLEILSTGSIQSELAGPELAASLHVSSRTLHRHCRTILGVSAKRTPAAQAGGEGSYCYSARLQPFRKDCGIRSCAGFVDPARFAVLYKSIYGEPPVATWRRSRNILSASRIT